MTRKFLVAALLFVATISAYSQVEQPTMLIQALDTTVHETSGLIFHNGKLWTHNDSGCANKIYSIDTITGQVLETKTIEGVTNEDWEDMAKDKSYLYIGNFGGTSTHKQILRIKLEDLDNPDLQVLQPRIINFTYGNPDYPEENYDATNTRFDCEAMIAKDDTIFLFSKNWVDHKTFLYAIPNKANYFHTIVPIDTLQLDYLVTSADYDYVTNTVALIGYTYSTINSRPHITLLRNFSGNDFFGGSVTNQEFSSPSGLTNQESGITYNQIEGVAFRDSSRIWVTNELLNKTVSFITLRIESHLREFVITNPQAVNDPADEPTFPEEPLPIIIDIEHSETTILEGDSVRFYDRSSQNPTSLIWTFEGGEPQTSTNSTPVVTYNTKGDYSVSLTAENESSLVNKTYNQLVHVLGYANADFYADTTNICQNDSIVFHNSSENASSIQWTFEGGEPEFSTEENPTVTYHNAGNFYVKLAVQNELSADTVVIESMISVDPSVTADFWVEEAELVQHGTVNFHNESQNATGYLWTFEGGEPESSTEENPEVTYPNHGVFSVVLEAYNQTCRDTKTSENYIEVINGISESTNANFTVYPNPSGNFITISYPEQKYTFEVLNSNGALVMKSHKETFSTEKVDISFLKAGIYFVRIITQDGTEELKFVKL